MAFTCIKMFLKKPVLQNVRFLIVVTQAVSKIEVLDSTDLTIQVNITKTHGNNKLKDWSWSNGKNDFS